MLTKMQECDVLFIDEIHRLPAAVEEYIYPAMEEFKIDFTLDSGLHARVMTYQLKPFTLIGAPRKSVTPTGPFAPSGAQWMWAATMFMMLATLSL